MRTRRPLSWPPRASYRYRLPLFEPEGLSAIARLDVLCAFTERAVTLDFCCPELSEQTGIDIRDGRHPVIEHVQSEAFTPNHTDMNPVRRMLIITGPNMGGKSTYMRQTALICLLAYTGSWVPASSAVIGPLDRIFTRIGAGDDLSRGRSTFMVEMVETAAILNQAGPRALVILDEIGRGTSTFDGLSIAWACVEHLHEANRCRALFATHYHELTELSDHRQGIKNVFVTNGFMSTAALERVGPWIIPQQALFFQIIQQNFCKYTAE